MQTLNYPYPIQIRNDAINTHTLSLSSTKTPTVVLTSLLESSCCDRVERQWFLVNCLTPRCGWVTISLMLCSLLMYCRIEMSHKYYNCIRPMWQQYKWTRAHDNIIVIVAAWWWCHHALLTASKLTTQTYLSFPGLSSNMCHNRAQFY